MITGYTEETRMSVKRSGY